MMLRALGILLGVSLAVGAQARAEPRFVDPVDDAVRIYELIDARLALMDDVAQWKWLQGRAIADPAREAQVAQSMGQQALELGLEAQVVREFFELQFSLAREIQTQRFDAWRAGGFRSSGAARDLDKDIRPRLDAIGVDLLRALYLAAPDLAATLAHSRTLDWSRRVGARFAESVRIEEQLRAVLLRLRAAAPGQLRAVRTSGYLRIGMTGDYAPFALERDGILRGADVEAALRLAQALHVEARFVRTSWSNLLDDMQRRRFDVAAGGVSITPERAARATFSLGYFADGKTAIARCERRARFSSLRAIDRRSVRVIVNPGGTNERFVRERLKRAQVRVHADNLTIFEELLANRADVMITDAIEVQLQTRKHPQLCRTTTELFTSAQKALLLPRAADLATFVDAWLRERIASGAQRALLQEALGAD